MTVQCCKQCSYAVAARSFKRVPFKNNYYTTFINAISELFSTQEEFQFKVQQ